MKFCSDICKNKKEITWIGDFHFKTKRKKKAFIAFTRTMLKYIYKEEEAEEEKGTQLFENYCYLD